MRNREEAKTHILNFISPADSISVHLNDCLDEMVYSKTLNPNREDRDPNLFFILFPNIKKVSLRCNHITFTDNHGMSYRLYRYCRIENVYVRTNGYNVLATINRVQRGCNLQYRSRLKSSGVSVGQKV